jgi:hypothetical protein
MLGPSGTGKPGFLLGLSEAGGPVLGPSEAGPDFLLGLSETGVPVLGPLSGTEPPSDTRAARASGPDFLVPSETVRPVPGLSEATPDFCIILGSSGTMGPVPGL